MSDGKQKPRPRIGWPGSTLWLMKWAVIVALVVLILLAIFPRGTSAWNTQSEPDGHGDLTQTNESPAISVRIPVKPITYRSEATRVLDYGAK